MSTRKRENIKASCLKRLKTIPMLAENALQSFRDIAGVFYIDVPPETTQPIMVLNAQGTFAFGGLTSDNTEIYISKIVIDDLVVLDRTPGDYLASVFASKTEAVGDVIAGNTPPFLVNNHIQIYAVNHSKSKGNGNSSSTNTLAVSLVPIE